ncbi:hypothetical protein Mgra_00001657 [Meloidogyne graminicola]|uniref:Uncharacterized protein n=1 Tax=Meloidogyne graminicola TaxID=189291 RepID=A0A8T0A021_9BILA|nr:hypothetical protein Mgra_00001657 [Meloidogyne graminicola]
MLSSKFGSFTFDLRRKPNLSTEKVIKQQQNNWSLRRKKEKKENLKEEFYKNNQNLIPKMGTTITYLKEGNKNYLKEFF